MAYKSGAKRAAPAEEETQSVFELDAKKQVTVRRFNGVSLVDIREFYIDKDTKEKKPGKKGISLTQEVWRKLMERKDEIDEALGELEGKKRKTEDDSKEVARGETKEDTEEKETS